MSRQGVGNPVMYAQAAKSVSPAAQVLVVGGVVLLVGYVIHKVNSSINTVQEVLQIKDTKEEKQEKEAILKFEKSSVYKLAFTPDPWIGKTDQIITISSTTALKYAETINDAFGVVNDDESAIYGVFKSIASKASIAKLAVAYYVKYKTDLYFVLKDKLSRTELIVILKIVAAKKDYTKKP